MRFLAWCIGGGFVLCVGGCIQLPSGFTCSADTECGIDGRCDRARGACAVPAPEQCGAGGYAWARLLPPGATVSAGECASFNDLDGGGNDAGDGGGPIVVDVCPTDAGVPLPPVGVFAYSRPPNQERTTPQIGVRWQAGSDHEQHFVVERTDVTCGASCFEELDAGGLFEDAGVLGFIDAPPASNAAYSYRVSACDQTCSAPALSITVATLETDTDTTPPAEPNLEVTMADEGECNEVLLHWNHDPRGKEDLEYVVEYEGAPIARTLFPNRQFFHRVAPGQSHDYTVTAVDQAGNTFRSANKVVVAEKCPEACPGITAIELETHPDHCGSCNHSCAGGVCVGGRCQSIQLSTQASSALALTDSAVFAISDGALYRHAKALACEAVQQVDSGLGSASAGRGGPDVAAFEDAEGADDLVVYTKDTGSAFQFWGYRDGQPPRQLVVSVAATATRVKLAMNAEYLVWLIDKAPYVQWVRRADLSGIAPTIHQPPEAIEYAPIHMAVNAGKVFWWSPLQANPIYWAELGEPQEPGDPLFGQVGTSDTIQKNAIVADDDRAYWAGPADRSVSGDEIDSRLIATNSDTRIADRQAGAYLMRIADGRLFWVNDGAWRGGGEGFRTPVDASIVSAPLDGSLSTARDRLTLHAERILIPTDVEVDERAIYWTSELPDGPHGVFKVAR